MRSSDNPAPPCATGRARYDGNPREQPPPREHRRGIHRGDDQRQAHQPGPSTGAGHRALSGRTRDGRSSHTCDSSTERRIHSVSSAGATPARNTPRQPQTGSTSALTAAAGRVADRPGALHDAERLAAVLRRPGLGDQRGARGPLAAHAEPEHDAEERELLDRLRKTAGSRRERVDRDRRGQRPRAADAVGQPPEQRTADGRRGQRQRDRAGRSCDRSARTRGGCRSGRTNRAGRPSRRASTRATPPPALAARMPAPNATTCTRAI